MLLKSAVSMKILIYILLFSSLLSSCLTKKRAKQIDHCMRECQLKNPELEKHSNKDLIKSELSGWSRKKSYCEELCY